MKHAIAVIDRSNQHPNIQIIIDENDETKFVSSEKEAEQYLLDEYSPDYVFYGLIPFDLKIFKKLRKEYNASKD